MLPLMPSVVSQSINCHRFFSKRRVKFSAGRHYDMSDLMRVACLPLIDGDAATMAPAVDAFRNSRRFRLG